MLPGWLAALLTAPRPAALSLECRSSGDGTVRAPGAYARAALQRESDAVRGAVTGGRTHALNKAAYHLGQLIAAGALDDAAAETALYDAASVHFAADQPVTHLLAVGQPLDRPQRVTESADQLLEICVAPSPAAVTSA